MQRLSVADLVARGVITRTTPVRTLISPIWTGRLDDEIAGIEAVSAVGEAVVVLLQDLDDFIDDDSRPEELDPLVVDMLVESGCRQARIWYFG